MTKSAMLKRLAALERENKMLRSVLDEAGWIEGRAVIRAAMRIHELRATSGSFTEMLKMIEGRMRIDLLDRACARLAAKRKAMRAK